MQQVLPFFTITTQTKLCSPASFSLSLSLSLLPSLFLSFSLVPFVLQQDNSFPNLIRRIGEEKK